MTLPATLVVVACLVTVLEFPIGFGHVVAGNAYGMALLFTRNGLLVVAALTAALQLWRTTAPPRAQLPPLPDRSTRVRQTQPS
jgi:hypothetical protein